MKRYLHIYIYIHTYTYKKDSVLKRFHLVAGNHQLSQNSIAVRLTVRWLAFKHTWQLKLHKLKHTESLMLEASQLTVSNSEYWPTLSMLKKMDCCWYVEFGGLSDKRIFDSNKIGWLNQTWCLIFECLRIKGDLKTSLYVHFRPWCPSRVFAYWSLFHKHSFRSQAWTHPSSI